MKQCSKCKRILSESTFYYRKKGGKLRNDCIDCHKKQDLEYYQKNKEKKREWQKKYYEKNKDRIKKYRLKNRERKKEWRKKYRQKEYVKQKEIEYSTRYRQKNLEKVKTKDREYYYKNREKKLEYEKRPEAKARKQDYLLHPDVKIRRRKIYKKYHKNHLFEHRLHESKRRIKLKSKNIEHAFTKEEWEQKIALTNGICPMCNKAYSDGYGLTIDHNPPLSKAPNNFVYTINHIQPLCMSCNSSKGNKMRQGITERGYKALQARHPERALEVR